MMTKTEIKTDPPIVSHLQIFTGTIVHYAQYDASAIRKKTLLAPKKLTTLGIEGDEQFEKAFHGGIDRALCHYPLEHYDYWQTVFPGNPYFQQQPAFGENLSTTGLTEEQVFIGDIFQLGEAIIQVTKPRSPCYKVNEHSQTEDLSLQMQNSGRCGWLYRVIQTGMITPDASMKLLARPGLISVKSAIDITFNQPFDRDKILSLLSSPGLSTSLTRTLMKRLQTEKIESFTGRLFKQP